MANSESRNITWESDDFEEGDGGDTGPATGGPGAPMRTVDLGTSVVVYFADGTYQVLPKDRFPSAGSAPRQGDPDLASNQALERELAGKNLAQKQAELAEQQRQFNERFGQETSMFNQRQAVDEGSLTGFFRGAPTLDREKLGENSYQFSAQQAFDYYKRLQDLASNPRNFVANFFQNRGQAVPPGAQAYGNTSQKLSAMKPFEQFLPEFLGSQGRAFGRGASVGQMIGGGAQQQSAPAPVAPAVAQTQTGNPAVSRVIGSGGIPGMPFTATPTAGGGLDNIQAQGNFALHQTPSVAGGQQQAISLANGVTFDDFKNRLAPYANGGVVPEPVIGRGVISGQTYTFGEEGPEGVVPADMLPDFLKRGAVPRKPMGRDPERVFADRESRTPFSGGRQHTEHARGTYVEGGEWGVGQPGMPRPGSLLDRLFGIGRSNSYALGGLIGYDEAQSPYGGDNLYGGDPYSTTPDYPYNDPNDPTNTPYLSDPSVATQEQGTELRATTPYLSDPNVARQEQGTELRATLPNPSLPATNTVIPPPQPFALTPEQQADIQRQIAETAARNRQTQAGAPPAQAAPAPQPVVPVQQPLAVPQAPGTAMPVAAAPVAPANPFTGQPATNRDVSPAGTFGRTIPGATPQFLPGEDQMGGESTLQALVASGMLPPFLARLFAQQAGIQSQGTNQGQRFDVPQDVPIVSELALSQMTPTEREAFLSYISSYGIDPTDYLEYVRSLGPTGGAAQSPLFGARLAYNRQ